MDVTERQAGDRQRLRDAARGEPNALQRDRLRCVSLALDGHDQPTLTAMTGRSRGFVQRWVYAYRDGGLDAVRARPRGGNKPRLLPQDTVRFLQRVAAGPAEGDGLVCALRGEDCRRILRDEFGVSYALNGVYQLLQRHGFSCLRPRPRHRKADPDAQQRWRAEAPFLSKASASNTPTDTSKSGARTRHASASKAR